VVEHLSIFTEKTQFREQPKSRKTRGNEGNQERKAEAEDIFIKMIWVKIMGGEPYCE
jgi:hypothetical protein